MLVLLSLSDKIVPFGGGGQRNVSLCFAASLDPPPDSSTVDLFRRLLHSTVVNMSAKKVCSDVCTPAPGVCDWKWS